MCYNTFFAVVSTIFLINCTEKSKDTNIDQLTIGNYFNKQEYLHARQQLLAQDSALAFDASMQLSEQETALNEKLSTLKDSLIAEANLNDFFPPARYFYKSQQFMEETMLYRIFRKMPKGGILHVHPSASGDFHWIVEHSTKFSNCYVYWDETNTQYIKGQLQFFSEGEVPEGFVSTIALKKQLPDYEEQLYNLLTFDVSIGEDSVNIWKEFEYCFRRIGLFVNYQPVFKQYYLAALDTLAADGIQHVEFRAFLGAEKYDLEHAVGSGYYNGDSTVQSYQEVLAEIQQKYPDFTLKLIHTNSRFNTPEAIAHDYEYAFQLRKKYPDFISGYDLVAEEDEGNSTLYYLDTWLKRDSLRQVYGVDVPFFFHDGESDWPSVTNLYDAVLLGTERIGHGFNLFRFPALQKLVKEHDIAIEVNPLSNQILGYVRDLRIHPAVQYINQGIVCTISPDDPGVFGYKGVTPDYWSVFLAWGLDLKGIKKLILNSLTHSSLSDTEKEIALQNFEIRWQQWLEEAEEILQESKQVTAGN
jgi:adenosine deaminase CECR1